MSCTLAQRRCLSVALQLLALIVFVLFSGCARDNEAPTIPSPFVEGVAPVAEVVSPSSSYASEPTPKAVAPRSFSLAGAIQQAMKADPQIRAAFENIPQAQGDLLTAGLPPNPLFSTSGSLLPLDRSFSTTRQGGPPQFDAGISYPVDWFLFGKRAAALKAAQGGINVAAASFAETIRQRIAGTIASYYDVLESRELLTLAQEDWNNLRDVEHATTIRANLGDIGSIEVDRVRLSIFSSRRELRAREVALVAVESRLRTYLGLTENNPLELKTTLEVAHLAVPPNLPVAAGLAEANRPDLIALVRQVDQAQAVLTLEERKAYPMVAPRLGYTRQFQEQAIGYPDVNAWGIGVDMSLPLFDRNQGNIAKAQSVKRQAEFNLSAARIALAAEVNRSLTAFNAARETLANDDPGQLEAARHVRDKIRTAYGLGGKSLLEVLDAQRAYRETYRLHITGRSGYWHALNDLNAALGQQLLK